MKRLLILALIALASTTSFSQLARTNYGARNEPAGSLLVGVGQNNIADYTGFVTAVNYTPDYFMGYITITSSAEFNYMFLNLKATIAKLPKGMGLQIGLGFAGSGNSAKAANGNYDQNVKELANYLKTYPGKAYIRIGYEFDFKDNAYTKAYFKTAFIRFSNILRANANTATVWCSAGGAASATGASIISWYPGDAYTDWWGVDAFNTWEFQPANIGRLFGIADSAAAHKKPLMIGESNARGIGVLNGKVSWDKWFAGYFQFVLNAPSVKAISWINQNGKDHANDYPGAGNSGDNRLEKNPIVSNAFKLATLSLRGLFDTTIIKVPIIISTPKTVTMVTSKTVYDTSYTTTFDTTILYKDSVIITPRTAFGGLPVENKSEIPYIEKLAAILNRKRVK